MLLLLLLLAPGWLFSSSELSTGTSSSWLRLGVEGCPSHPRPHLNPTNSLILPFSLSSRHIHPVSPSLNPVGSTILMKDCISVNPLRCRRLIPTLGFEESAHCPKMLFNLWDSRSAMNDENGKHFTTTIRRWRLLGVGWGWHSYTLLCRCFLQR